MANKLITKYTWSNDWRLYNTKFNNGAWSEENIIIDEETGEEETYYTIATYHVLDTVVNGKTTTTTYAGIRVNHVGKFLIELLANSEPLSFDDIVASMCAHYGHITNAEIVEIQTVVNDFLNDCIEDVLVIKEYVTVAYVEALAAIAEDEIPNESDLVSDNLSPMMFAMDLDNSEYDVMSMSTEDETETPETETPEISDEDTEVDYGALINGTSKDPVNDILNLKKHKICSKDWRGEKEYINYQYEFRLVITASNPTLVHGTSMTDPDTNEEFVPSFVYPTTNADSMWGYVVGNLEGCDTFKMFAGDKNYNRDTLYEHCCEYYADQLESGETTLEELLDMCTTLYNTLVVTFKLKKALLVE